MRLNSSNATLWIAATAATTRTPESMAVVLSVRALNGCSTARVGLGHGVHAGDRIVWRRDQHHARAGAQAHARGGRAETDEHVARVVHALAEVERARLTRVQEDIAQLNRHIRSHHHGP